MSETSSITKPIFIIGTGRCGTHWLGQWLRSHPDCYGSAESHLFTILQPLVDREWNQGLKTWIPRPEIIAAVRTFAEETLARCQSRKEDEWRLVEYSWVHFEAVEFISSIYPDAKYIHIYRDGRNVVESWHRTSRRYPVSDIIDRWITYMTTMLDNPNPNIFHVKYEDLISSPNLSRRITDFLGMEHHRDIDSWEFPVNTPNYEYDPNRWESLPSSIIEQMQEMNPLLDKLKYYPFKPRMNKAELLKQLEIIKPYLDGCNWTVGGSACLVLQDANPNISRQRC